MKYGIPVVALSLAMLATVGCDRRAPRDPSDEWATRGAVQTVASLLLFGVDPLTVDETTIIEEPGKRTFAHTVRYAQGHSTREDTIYEAGDVVASLLSLGTGERATETLGGVGPDEFIVCLRVVSAECVGHDSWQAASSTAKLSRTATPDATATPAPEIDVSRLKYLPTAQVTVLERQVLGHAMRCTVSESPYGDSEDCATSDGLTRFYRSQAGGVARTHITRSQPSVPDGIFVPPYPVVTPTATP